MTLVGELALWVALLMAAWGAIVSFAGGSAGRPELVASGERALYATFACLVMATAGLLVALVTSDFSFQYVAAVTSANLPIGYKVTALWAGQAGALLSWSLIVSMYAVIAAVASHARHREVTPYVAGTLSIVLLFLLLAVCFEANPYERVVPIPVEGRGMNPELQHPAMALHPPTLTLGLAATTIPFAFAIAALLARQIDESWILAVRRWGAVSWFFMTIGIISGMWWAYVGPRRSWDWPLTGLSLATWLVATAFLSRATRQAKRGTTRAGRYALYAGVALSLIASVGFAFTKERNASLGPGEAVSLVDPYRREWTFTSQGVSDFPELNRAVEAVPLRVTRNGTPVGLIVTERRQYVDSRGIPTFAPFIDAGIDHSPLQDIYVMLTSITADRLSLRIAFHPLMVWAWIGGIAIAIGGTTVMWPAPSILGSRP